MRDITTNDLRHYSARAILADGSSIRIRAIVPEDREKLLDHFGRLSPESAYFRFMAHKKRLTDADLDRFTILDYVRNFGLVATRLEHNDERVIGVGLYAAAPGGEHPDTAEVAFAVDDEHQGRGAGTLLLEHLVRIARANGISRLEADVMSPNSRMLEVFARSGFVVTQSTELGVVRLWFAIEETEQFLTRSLYRENLAAAASISRLLDPKSVAIIGASQDTAKIGGAILANLKRGFTGHIYPINPHSLEVQGLKAFSNLNAVGQPVDLGVICVPAETVEEAVKQCAATGVHGVVVITSGFSEVSGEGRAAQDRIVELVRSSGMRMVGPNCMGIINTDPAVGLNATFAPIMPREGNIGMLSQSGALGIAILDQARVRNLGLSIFYPRATRRHFRQRHARLLGRRPAYESDRAVPGELRESAQVRATGSGGGAAKANRGGQVGTFRCRTPGRNEPFGIAGESGYRSRGVVRANRRDTHQHA